MTNYHTKVYKLPCKSFDSFTQSRSFLSCLTDYYINRHKLRKNKKKSCLYALIWDYSFINFQQKIPPIRLFSPIFLLLFKEFSHLYFYSDPSSIRNSRVGRSKMAKKRGTSLMDVPSGFASNSAKIWDGGAIAPPPVFLVPPALCSLS